MSSRKRPYYIASVERKRLKNTGTFTIDNNAFHEARRIGQETQTTVLVMREGIVIREFLPKSRGQLLVEEIEQTDKKLKRLREQLRTICVECGADTEELYDTGLCEDCQTKADEEAENEHDEILCDCPCHEKGHKAMRTQKAVINWISKQRRRFGVEIQVETKGAKANPYGVAVELPIDLLSEGMKEGQQVTIQIDDGDRDIDT